MTIYAIDLESLEWRILSTSMANDDQGPGLEFVSDLEFDEDSGRLFAFARWLLEVDVESGQRRLLSDSGAIFRSPRNLTVDVARDRGFLVDGRDLWSIDLTGGTHTHLGEKSGLTMLELDGDRLIAAGLECVEAFDLTDNTWVTLSSNEDYGEGPLLADLVAGALVPESEVVYLLDGGMPSVIAVDLESGDRVVVSR